MKKTSSTVKLKLCCLLFFYCLPAALFAQQKIVVAGSNTEVLLTPVTNQTVRVTILPLDASGKLAALKKDLVLAVNEHPPAFKADVTKPAGEIRVNDLKVKVAYAPLSLSFYNKANKLFQRLTFSDKTGEVAFYTGTQPLLGLGGGGSSFNRRGTYDEMEVGYALNESQIFGSRVPVPYLIGTEGWSLFFHLPYRAAFDLRYGTTGKFIPRANSRVAEEAALPLDIFVSNNEKPSDALTAYATITGKTPLPPKWAFGYMQSHRTLGDQKSLIDEAKTFREKQLPIDAMIYLGTGYAPTGWNMGAGNMDFNPSVFSKPDEAIKALHDEHLKVILHVNNTPRTLHGSMISSKTDTGHDYAFNYWKWHLPVFSRNIDGWWADDGDELPIPSRMTRHMIYNEGPLMARPNERPFSFHRTGYAGMQKYGGWLWSGDVYSLWSTLQANVQSGIGFSLSTSPYWGSDIGGFVSTKEFTGELYARWFQFAAFTPFFRSHGRLWWLHRPWGWSTGDMGPNEVVKTSPGADEPDKKEILNPDIEPICKKYLQLRYQLMSYTYSAARENYDTSLPLMRALWLQYPKDAEAVTCNSEYLWGSNILVAPVTEKGATTKKIYLPAGTWYDYWSNRRYEGDQHIVRFVDLATMPLFVKAGTILPLDPPRQYVDEPTKEHITLRIYTGANGEYKLYEDDGKTLDYQSNKGTNTTIFSWNDKEKTLTIKPAVGSQPSKAAVIYNVQLLPRIATSVRSITYQGAAINVKF
jgi:alpha-glucosidase (family GH31 glycosyl hydrolase)